MKKVKTKLNPGDIIGFEDKLTPCLVSDNCSKDVIRKIKPNNKSDERQSFIKY